VRQHILKAPPPLAVQAPRVPVGPGTGLALKLCLAGGAARRFQGFPGSARVCFSRRSLAQKRAIVTSSRRRGARPPGSSR